MLSPSLTYLSSCLASEWQCHSSAEASTALVHIAARIANGIEDPRERAAFLSDAGMSGLEVPARLLR